MYLEQKYNLMSYNIIKKVMEVNLKYNEVEM